MKWLSRLLRLDFKTKQQKFATEADEYIHGKKHEFQKDMNKLKEQSKQLHKKAVQTQEESVKLNKVVEDITTRIMLATGGKR
jgi:predicted  nucleic acid-binding Zn-ribbon protein